MHAGTAELYDAIYTRMKDYRGEAEKVRTWIEKLRPGARSVLDVACGTGEHAKHLCADYQIDGLDLNGDYLAAAHQKNPQGQHEVADMTCFDLQKKYDAVLCLFSAIGYALTVEKLNAAIRCMADHLAPQGALIVEPWLTPEKWKAGRPHLVSFEEENFKICRMNTTGVRGERTSFMQFHYLVGRPEGVTHFTEDHELGLFTKAEMLDAFRNAGLKPEHDEAGIFGRGLYFARKTGA
ncbi:class I SAM-dependent methyltransferase [Roseimicrobium sp. ORNL1]|uniref:class I SAM-dependent DNA methyltransferase n=1 Tax=Roseimicrobium sp. ORNL1 TaxID=2711231 RepID=UPI0013E1028F|nr:class I SAM-dependent methyltransferase [Roseimicrobium sp. ORNL1]QIF02172.1 class I SAM-dependent methyltransferase [Roseimicrobium sp. ORNL1]